MNARLAGRWRGFRNALSNLGLMPTLFYAYQRLRHDSSTAGVRFVVLSRHSRYPLHCRARTSDVDVFGQIFVDREYRCLDDVTDARLIIDCGANVGFSSAYFLSRHPRSFVVAIEPDPDNFAALERNLQPYEGRFRAIRSGVWSHRAGLVLSDEVCGDGREWARTVRESKAGEEPTMTGIDIGTLLAESNYERISILKIDIEGTESVVFSSNYEHWIDKVDNLVIELHGQECESTFKRAIAPFGYETSQCDELTVCRARAISSKNAPQIPRSIERKKA
jgi:FkbM family methyltransferase